MNILISTIIRDSIRSIDIWFDQINRIIDLCPNDKFYLSVYENDSVDGTKEKLKSFNYKKIEKCFITSENLGEIKYPSVSCENRVKLLASYRNKTLNQVENIQIFDKILSIEPDILYIPEDVIKLIFSDFDIYSGFSLRCRYEDISNLNFNTELWIKNLEEKLYSGWTHGVRDGWATRKNDTEINGIIDEKAYFDLYKDDVPLQSTYSSFAVYNPMPIKNGARFGFINEKYNKFDCDTAVICQEFNKLGYNNIYMNKNIKILHIE